MDRSKVDYFKTDHLLPDLKGRSVRGGAITLSAQAIKFILQLGSTVVLARLLTPDDFGLFAMVIAITAFVEMFKDAGLCTATIQRDEISHDQVSTLFWINAFLSVIVVVIIALLAPLIGWFYSEPRLIPVTLVLAVVSIFSGLSLQHNALLARQMQFRALASIEIISITIGIVVAIILAILDFAYWSLVGMTGGFLATNCALAWWLSGWRPSRPVRGSGVRPMLSFGGGLTSFNIVSYITRNLDNVIIGAVLGASPLGIYSRAYNLLLMPIYRINAPLSGVTIPALSRLQNNPDRFRNYYIKAVGMIASITMPIVAFVFIDADRFVLTILGPQWLEAASIFRFLAPAAFLGAIGFAPEWLCVTLGETTRQLRWSIVSAPIIAGSIIFGVIYGIQGVAIAFSISWGILFIGFVCYACYGSPVSVFDVVKAILPPVCSSLVAAGMAYASLFVSGEWAITVALLFNGIVFAISYTAVWCLMADRRQIRDLVNSLKSRLISNGTSE